MKKGTLLLPLLLAGGPLTAQDANTRHYWDMDTLDTDTGTTPVDLVGGLTTTIQDLSPTGDLVLETTTYGEARTGSANYLLTQVDTNGTWGSSAADNNDDVIHTDYLRATLEAGDMDFGTDSFSFSYWSYNETDDEGGLGDDVRGPRVFDCLSGTQTGIQLGSNASGIFNFRIDDDTGTFILSNNTLALLQGADVWTFVAVTANRTTGLAEVFMYDGTGGLTDGSQGTYDISGLSGDILPSLSYLEIGAINGGGNGRGIQDAGLDDLAFYSGVLSAQEITDLEAGTITPLDLYTSPPPVVTPPVAHYWDFYPGLSGLDTPQDLYGNLVTTEEGGFTNIGIDGVYGEAFTGAGESLNVALADPVYLQAETHDGTQATALDFGTGSFAYSYWAYDHFDTGTTPDAGDGDARGVRVFDCIATDTTGLTVNTDATGSLVVRIDDDAGNEIISNTITGFENVAMPTDQWVHVSMNVDRTANQLTIFFNGAPIPEGPIDISGLTGNVFCTTDLQIGVINNGGAVTSAQKSGLDDLAFYPDVLSQQQITDLAGATTTPPVILDTMVPAGPIPIVSVDYDAGEITVEFTSTNGKTYSVYGGQTLDDTAGWTEVPTPDLIGDSTDLSFSHTPGVTPFFLQVRED